MPAGQHRNKAYPLRIDEEVMEQVKTIATEENRTVNKQIEQILKLYIELHQTKKNIASTYITNDGIQIDIIKKDGQ